MRGPVRALAGAMACAAVVAVGACKPIAGLPGAAAGTPPGTAGGTPPTTTRCTDSYIGDPWIAFQSSFREGDPLPVGTRTWLSGPSRVSDIKVSGDTEAIKLAEGSTITEKRCGKVISTRSWVEMTGVRPGTVSLRYQYAGAEHTMKITVVE